LFHPTPKAEDHVDAVIYIQGGELSGTPFGLSNCPKQAEDRILSTFRRSKLEVLGCEVNCKVS